MSTPRPELSLATTFDHGADIGVVGEGATVEEAFAAAARAMFGLVVDLEGVTPRCEVEVACSASDLELLFVSWLNALLREAGVRRCIFKDFTVRIRDTSLVGTARGEPFDPRRHVRGVEVKGATLTELRVAKQPGGWRAQTVVDV